MSPPQHTVDGHLPAYGSPLPATPSPPPPSPPMPSAPATPTTWIDASTQTSVWWSPTRKVRRRVFEPHVRSLTLYPPSSQTFGQYVDITRPRRLCDCRLCVRHQADLFQKDVESDQVPPALGIRYLRLPGLPSNPSSEELRRQVDRELRSNPRKILVACGCQTCLVHRQLAEAWTCLLYTSPSPRD